MGDCNGVVSPELDRTSEKNIKITQGKLLNFVFELMDISLEKIDEELKPENLLRITERQRQIMNGPIRKREVSEAINKY